MSQQRFACLLVGSRDADIDDLAATMLTVLGHSVTRVAGQDLLTALAAATQPVVVVKNLNGTTSRWGASTRLRAAADLTRRAGFVLLSLYPEWQQELAPSLPAGHDITVLPLPLSLAQLHSTVEQVGQRVARRWEPRPPR
jgi:hypothetical protein